MKLTSASTPLNAVGSNHIVQTVNIVQNKEQIPGSAVEIKSADSLSPIANARGNFLPAKQSVEGLTADNQSGCGAGEAGVDLENLKPVGFINGKPVFVVPTTTVLNTKSGFGHKLLCDFLTITAGSACVFSCAFCYVITLLQKNKYIKAILGETRLNFSDIIVRREYPVPRLREQLTSRGKPKFKHPCDNRVCYGSPLVDVAATMDLVKETVEMCLVILELTNWQIRLLSKSPLLLQVAERIPAEFKPRMIYGFSTGTLDVGMGNAIEKGTGLVSKRIEALHTLQDRGYRTYGMACPVLPQPDMKQYAVQMAQALRLDKCEDVWVEILNSRDDSMAATEKALRKGGFCSQADLFAEATRTAKDREDYARETFLAFAEVIPAKKLHFLQYVNKNTLRWWSKRKQRGAVLLGKAVPQAAY